MGGAATRLAVFSVAEPLALGAAGNWAPLALKGSWADLSKEDAPETPLPDWQASPLAWWGGAQEEWQEPVRGSSAERSGWQERPAERCAQRRGRSKCASRLRKPAQDLTRTTGIQPPYLVRSEGHITGYKVHVGDLPADKCPAELRAWVRAGLKRANCPDADDIVSSMGKSTFRQSQVLLTFAALDVAQRAQRALDKQRVGPGVVSNAKLWVPKGYDAWRSDPRFWTRSRGRA